jgi:hypothetical protein
MPCSCFPPCACSCATCGVQVGSHPECNCGYCCDCCTSRTCSNTCCRLQPGRQFARANRPRRQLTVLQLERQLDRLAGQLAMVLTEVA